MVTHNEQPPEYHDHPPVLKLLAHAEFFIGLETSGLHQVLQAARKRRLEQQETCFQQDDPADFLYLLCSGRMKLTQLTADGRQVLLRFVDPGEVFGGIALFTGERYPVTAEAVDECELLLWDGPAMQRLMEAQPGIARNVIQHLAELVKSLQDRVRELSTERVEQRLARALIRLAQPTGQMDAPTGSIEQSDKPSKEPPPTTSTERFPLAIHLTRQDLGELTGTTLYTVSRILSRWERDGWIESGRERITLIDPTALQSLAEDS